MMRLKVLNGADIGRVLEIVPDFTIGREVDNNYVVEDDSVSRHHCRFSRRGSAWFAEDLQSLNGVYVNGDKLTIEGRIYDRDVIRIHSYEFQVMDDDPANARHAAAALKVPPAETNPQPADASDSSAQTVLSAPSPVEGGKPAGGKLVGVVGFVLLLAVIGFLAKSVFKGEPEEEPEPAASTEQVQNPAPIATPSQEINGMLSADDLKNLKSETLPQQPAPEAEPEEEAPATPAPVAQTPVFVPPAPVEQKGPQNILVESTPAGATIYLDKKQFGVTPAVLRDIAQGRHILELQKDGYETVERPLVVNQNYQSQPVELTAKLGTVTVESTPAGAWVWEGRRLLGVTPVVVEGLCEGEHELRVEGPACKPHMEKVTIAATTAERVNVQLESLLGSLEVTTRPAGFQIYLNGALLGTTVHAETGNLSKPFLVENLAAGMALLKIEHPSGLSDNARIQILPGKVNKQSARYWLPTHRLKLADGEAVGMLIEVTDRGDYVLELANRKMERYLKPQIIEAQQLTDEEIKEIIASSKKAGAKGPRDAHKTTAEQFGKHVRDMNDATFRETFVGHKILITGKPTSRFMDKGNIVVLFGFNIRATFVDGTPETVFQQIADLIEAGKTITINGICERRANNMAFLKDCILEE
ncbi:MAG: PEGA domain-containing protein [Victivallales bacterium]|nr:PEGA domain-containing protein [Victivallales bacterium]